MEQSGRRTLGIRRRRQGALGLGASSRPGPTPPDLEEFLRRSQDRLRTVLPGGNLGGKGLMPDRARRGRHLGILRLLPCRPRRTRRGAALRQICARGAARTELSPAVSDRDGAHAQGAARQQDRHRHAHRRGSAPRHHHARRAGREPDAHRRREHRRRRFLRAVEDQAERRGRLSVQHPAARRHGEGGRRKRHARGGRPLQHSADPDRRAAEHRNRRAGSDADPFSTNTAPAFRSRRCSCRRSIRPRR